MANGDGQESQSWWDKLHDKMQKDWEQSTESEAHKTKSTCPEHTSVYKERVKRSKEGDPTGTAFTGN
jgi:hypothetical protein